MRPRLLILAMVLSIATLCTCADAKGHEKNNDAVPQPETRIPLENLGLRGTPTRGLLRSQAAIATLDFIDSGHVLLTFAARPLVVRGDEKTSEEEHVPESMAHPRSDRSVHAEVVELATGKILHERDWRLHDREAYLVALGGGQFLLRHGGQLKLVDGQLQERKLAESTEPIVHMQAEMGSGLLVVEKEREVHTPELHAQMAHDALLSDAKPPAEEADAFGWKLPLPEGGEGLPRPALFHARLPREGELTGNQEGLVGFSGAGRKVEVYFEPFAKDAAKRMLVRVPSDCRPATRMLRSDVLLVTACKGNESVLTAADLDGTLLWSRRSQAGLLPEAVASEDGRRFALQSVGGSVNSMMAVPLEDDFAEGLVQVFDVDTGERVFSTVLEPLYGARRTVALSADGLKLGMLRKGALEVYALPPVQAAPEAKTKQKGRKK